MASSIIRAPPGFSVQVVRWMDGNEKKKGEEEEGPGVIRIASLPL